MECWEEPGTSRNANQTSAESAAEFAVLCLTDSGSLEQCRGHGYVWMG